MIEKKKIKKNPYREVYALGQHIRMSAHKARRVIDQIRGRSYEETLMILEAMPYRACYPIYKLLDSAAANANHNMGFNQASLVISKAEVNEGITMKRLQPGARGRSYPIKKPTCHITIVLRDISLDKTYQESTMYFKKSGWRNKHTNRTYPDIYTSQSSRSGGLWDKKINPLGFRLGTTQSHHSVWFAQPKNYSDGLQEDKKIRDYIKNYVQKNMRVSSGVEGIVRIEIQKRIDVIQVIIYMGFPKFLIEDRPRRIKELQMNVQKELNCVNRKLKLNIAVTRIENPYGHPNILAEFIAGQLKNRVSCRKAMKKAIELTEQTDTKGIRVQIAGRTDGKEQARVIWIREGRVPLQTIGAKIDYSSYTVRTIYGALGIKIWIFRDKE